MEGYMTIKQTAEKWEVTPRRIQKLCVDGSKSEFQKAIHYMIKKRM